jgi:hypothetical protein
MEPISSNDSIISKHFLSCTPLSLESISRQNHLCSIWFFSGTFFSLENVSTQDFLSSRRFSRHSRISEVYISGKDSINPHMLLPLHSTSMRVLFPELCMFFPGTSISSFDYFSVYIYFHILSFSLDAITFHSP